MEFIFQKNSALPAHTQIKEQIKVALLLGNLRPGEMLPSIRDLEEELGINRNIVRKAYVELEELGILKLIHGKGVMVNKNLKYKEDKEFLQNCEELVETTKRSCQRKGLNFSSFARYLYHKAIESEKQQAPLLYVDMSSELAKERADQISMMLHIKTQGFSTEELKELVRTKKKFIGIKVICNYYRLDEVTKILRGQSIDIVPLRMMLGEQTKKELSQLPEGAKVAFIFDVQDESRLSMILEDYRKAFADRKLVFVSRSVNDFKSRMKLNGYARLIVSNRIWNDIPKTRKKASNITHPIMEFDSSSLEESKMQLGIIA
jgi:GntR family transcriptional regulator